MNGRLGLIRSLAVLTRYHSRLLRSVLEEVRQRYAGSVFGLSWAVIYPILLLSLYAMIYVVIFKVRPASLSEYEYVILVFSGLVPLLAFNDALMSSTSSLLSNRSLLMNTVFPAELIPVRAVLAAQVPSLSSITITLAAGYWMGRTGWQAPFAIPVLWLLLLMFAVGLGWMLSLLTLVARDIQHMLGLILMALVILSPFAFTPDMVPAGLKSLLYVNPLSYFVLSFQQVIAYGRWPEPVYFLPVLALSFGSFFGGFWFFLRTKYVFFDYA